MNAQVERLGGRFRPRCGLGGESRFTVALSLLLSLTCAGAGQGFSQAPALAAQVAAGTLPALERRLPRSPLLVQPTERIGRYGGAWRMGILEPSDIAFYYRTIGYEPLVRWDPSWTRVVPNVAQQFEVNASATEFTFTLREGLRWSDGHPFTAEDIEFWAKSVLQNRDIYPSPPDWMAPGGKPGTVEKLGPTKVRFRFLQPHGLFLAWLATPNAPGPTSNPKHYLSRFFPEHNPELAALVQQRGVQKAADLYNQEWSTVFLPPASNRCPSLNAWVIDGTQRNAEGRTAVLARRNPYYWKVDPAGNQLPYLDTVHYALVDNLGALLNLALRGEVDFQDYHLATRENRARFEAGQTQGDYHLVDRIPSVSNDAAIIPNLTHREARMRRLMQEHAFRVALSLAIDRGRLIREVFGVPRKPYQVAPRPESPFYHPQLATQHLGWDTNRATTLLSSCGLRRPEGRPWWEFEDGRPVSLMISAVAGHSASWVQIAGRVAADWQRVGIQAAVEVLEPAAFHQKRLDNRHDVILWGGDGGLDVTLDPRFYLPFSIDSNFALPWALWRTNPAHPLAEKPPQDVLQQFAAYNRLLGTADPAGQDAAMREILDIAAEQFYVLGISLSQNAYALVHNRFHNVPRVMPAAWTYPSPAPSNPCQYFADSP